MLAAKRKKSKADREKKAAAASKKVSTKTEKRFLHRKTEKQKNEKKRFSSQMQLFPGFVALPKETSFPFLLRQTFYIFGEERKQAMYDLKVHIRLKKNYNYCSLYKFFSK
jgi:hypothetical protein